jgi:tripartite-type tricarboxylate transporter receptor subunit TctC
MMKRIAIVVALVAIAAVVPARIALAQAYPSKSIRLVAPFPPGGSVDVVGRMIAVRLSESLGQQVVVDNRSGASGNIGTEFVMNSAPDGYTLMINTIPLVVNQFMLTRVPYDALKDFAPVMLISSSPSILTVHPSVPARSVKEFIALAKSKPGALNYSGAGIGTNPHIAGELFNLLANVNIVCVQYKGGGPADLAVMGGEVAASFPNISQAINYVSSKRLRALGVTSTARAAAMPDLPTIAEAGVPGYEFVTWHAILAPKGTPPAVVNLLNERLKKILTTPSEAQFYKERGLDVIASTPAELTAHLEAEQKKWGRVIRERGIKAD